ncbi:ribonuclease H1 domain-containing protein [Bacillus pacificus]
MAKFYAVKRGRKEGIFTSWDECKEQVTGFPNALYKSFPTYEEAKSFIDGKSISNPPERKEEGQISDITAYIDGSYDDRKKLYSYAGIIFLKNNERTEFSYADSNSSLISLRNVAGEIKAAMHVIDLALKMKLSLLTFIMIMRELKTGQIKVGGPTIPLPKNM